MTIKTLLKDSLASLEIIIEKSDNGRLFFGALRDDPKNRACYTFDIVKMPGRLLELVRNSDIALKDGTIMHVDFDMVIDNKRRIVSCSSRSHPKNPAKAADEIERAYKLVSLYKKHFLKNPDNKRLYPEILDYLGHITAYPSAIFREKYSFV